ncbi:MAG: PorT family protein [Saprospiraceae bacterium]|jgi:hypothetical protein|nr:PorT family protein [Saprospiraceae bacterium]
MMKKIVSIAIFLSVLVQFSFAQVQGDKRFGFQLSPTFNWMSADDNKINPSGTLIGLKLGMLSEWYFSDNYAVTSGLGFSFNTGGTLLFEEAGRFWTQSDVPENAYNNTDVGNAFAPQTKLKYSLQYVEIPIGLKMKVGEIAEKEFSYFLEPFLALGIRTQARGTIEGGGDDAESINIREDVNLINLSWGIGAGAEYGLNDQTSLIAGLGVQIGFADATDDDGGKIIETVTPLTESDEDSKGTINAIILKIGIMF